MSHSSKNIAGTIEKLTAGWTEGPSPLVDEFLAFWKERVAPYEIRSRSAGALHFTTSLPNSRLRGAESIHCLALGGDAEGLGKMAEAFVREHSEPGRWLFFLSFSPAGDQALKATAGCERRVILSAEELRQILSEEDSIKALRGFVRRTIPVRSLMPYDILLSATGPMFYGRQAELKLLEEEDGQSFAVTGPSRIGKTSLVKRYRSQLFQRKDPSAQATFYIDCFEFQHRSPDAVARKIAMAIDAGSRAARTGADDIVGFLKQMKGHLGCRPTLILDEADEVCQSSLFYEQLNSAVRQGVCRLILSGRGNVLRLALGGKSGLAERLKPIFMRSLDNAAAKALLYEPMQELGIDFEDFDQCWQDLAGRTGRCPHLIQFYGQRLVELAHEEGIRRIQPRHLDLLHWDFTTVSYFLSPLDDLKQQPVPRAIALAILRSGAESFTTQEIQGIGASAGIVIGHDEAMETARTLVVQNVLGWNDGQGWRVANKALAEYAQRMGYLSGGFEEARRDALNKLSTNARSGS